MDSAADPFFPDDWMICQRDKLEDFSKHILTCCCNGPWILESGCGSLSRSPIGATYPVLSIVPAPQLEVLVVSSRDYFGGR